MAKQKIKLSVLKEAIRRNVRVILEKNPQILAKLMEGQIGTPFGTKAGQVNGNDHKKLGTKDSGSNAPTDSKWHMKNKPTKKEVKVSDGSKKKTIENAPAGATEKAAPAKKFSFNMSKVKRPSK